MKKKLTGFVGYIYRKCMEVASLKVGLYASSTTFFLVMSAVPLMIALFSVIPYTPLRIEDVKGIIDTVVPSATEGLLGGIIDDIYVRSAGRLSVSIVFSLWSASVGVMSLKNGFNSILDINETRNYFLVRVISMLYTVVLLAALFASFFVSVFGGFLHRFFENNFPYVSEIIAEFINYKEIVTFFMGTMIFAIIYCVLPNKKMNILRQIPGAVFAALGWSVFSWILSFLVDDFGAYSSYGGMATFAILLIWLYACIYIVFLGFYINRRIFLIMERRAAKRAEEEGAKDELEEEETNVSTNPSPEDLTE